MKQSMTLTIGIPAHNEQANIADLLQSLLEQKGNFTLERILVICDGCTDNTASIVKKLARQYPIIALKNDGKRLGKVSRLNEIYEQNTSDLLLTLDGDILPKRSTVIDTMVSQFISHPKTQVVAAYMEPIQPKTWSLTSHGLYINYVMWNAIVTEVNNGDHIHNVHGPASMLRKKFAKSFAYPEDITCDEGFLYMKAHECNGFRFAKDAKFLIVPIATVCDIEVGIPRILNERFDLIPYFGEGVLEQYKVPIGAKIHGVLQTFFLYPIATTVAVAYNIIIKLKYTRTHGLASGVWQQVTSTKRAIQVK
jgi:glycosyltransferase involved in cell wall biosynthesis